MLPTVRLVFAFYFQQSDGNKGEFLISAREWCEFQWPSKEIQEKHPAYLKCQDDLLTGSVY